MSIQRIATPEVVAQRLIELLAERVSMNIDDVLPALRAEGLKLPDDEDYLLDDVLDAEVGLDIMEIDDLLIHQPSLLNGRVFTHRVTADDISGEFLDIHDDLAPLLWWLRNEVLVTASAEPWSPELVGSQVPADTAHGTTASHVSPARPVETADGLRARAADADRLTRTDHGTADRPAETARAAQTADSTAATHDSAARPAEIVRVAGGSVGLILPDPTLTSIGVEPGDLLAITVRGRTLHLCPTDDVTADPAMLAVLAELADECLHIEELVDVCLLALVRRPELFTTLLPPLGELLATTDIPSKLRPSGQASSAAYLALSEEAAQAAGEANIKSLSKLYDISIANASIITEITDAVSEMQFAVSAAASLVTEELRARLEAADAASALDNSAPDVADLLALDPEELMPELPGSLAEKITELLESTDPIAADWPKFVADPWLVHILAEQCVRDAQAPQALGLVLERMPATTDRAGRSNRAYLEGRVSEATGQPLHAAACYRRAADLTGSPVSLLQLAGIEFDKGNLAAASSLLDRAQADDTHPLRIMLSDVLIRDGAGTGGKTVAIVGAEPPARKPGRNAPCWCGSGRKYKVCHGRPGGGEKSLIERSRVLNDKLVWWLLDNHPIEVQELFDVACAAAGRDLPEGVIGPMVFDTLLIEDGLIVEYLEQRGELLPPDEAMLVTHWQFSERSVFDVEAVTPGEALHLRDLRTGTQMVVPERRGTEGLDGGEYVCTRVVDVDGQPMIFGCLEPVALNKREGLIALLDSQPSAAEVVRWLAGRFAAPVMLTTNGEPMVFVAGSFSVAHPVVLAEWLDARDDMLAGWDDEDSDGDSDSDQTRDHRTAKSSQTRSADVDHVRGQWDWIEPVVGGVEGEVRPLATLSLTGGLLSITAMAERRYENVVGILETSGISMIEREVTRTDASELLAQSGGLSALAAGGANEDDWENDAGMAGLPGSLGGGPGSALGADSGSAGPGPGSAQGGGFGSGPESAAGGPGSALGSGPGSGLGSALGSGFGSAGADPRGAAGAGPGSAAGGASGSESDGGFMSMDEALAHPELSEIIGAKIAQYERQWLDEPIPALSGLTPREAAADPTRRDDLIRLLNTLPAEGLPHKMDGGRLRAALGL